MQNIDALRFVPIIKFLDLLRKEGYDIGVDTHLHFARLLKQVKPSASKDDVALMLCPLVARSKAEQEKFYPLFRTHSSTLLQFNLDEYKPKVGIDLEKELPRVAQHTVTPQARPITKPKPLQKDTAPYIDLARIGLMVILAIIVYLNIFYQTEKETDSELEEVAIASNKLETTDILSLEGIEEAEFQMEQREHYETTEIFRDTSNKVVFTPVVENLESLPNRLNDQFSFKVYQNKNNIKAVIIVLLFAMLFYSMLRQYLKRIKRRTNAKDVKDEEREFNLPLNINNKQYLNYETEFYAVMNQFRKREKSDRRVLNMPRTINATVHKGGIINFQYDQMTKPREYLVLIDKAMNNVYHIELFNQIYQSLVHNDIYAERFYFERLPDKTWNEEYSDGLSLEELHLKYGHCRLLLFTNGKGFLDQETGKIDRKLSDLLLWDNRVILTPKAMNSWSSSEKALEQQFIVLPSNLQGFSKIVDHFEGTSKEALEQWKDDARESDQAIVIDKEQVFMSLDAHFEKDMQRWIAACAVYPHLDWDLCIRLGHLMSQGGKDNLVNYNNIRKLGQLEWFQQGEIPAPVRAILLTHPAFSIDDERLVREELRKILKENIPDKETKEHAIHQLFLATNDLLIEPSGKNKQKNLRHFRDQYDPSTPQDIVQLARLHQIKTTIGVLVPARFRKYIFEEGNELLGVNNWVAFLSVCFMALCVMIPKFYYLPFEDKQEINGNYYSTNTWEDKALFAQSFSKHLYNEGAKAYNQNNFIEAEKYFKQAIAYEDFSRKNNAGTQSETLDFYHALGATQLYQNKTENLGNLIQLIKSKEADYFKKDIPNLEYCVLYNFIGNEHDGLIRASQNRKFGFINKEGDVVIPFNYDNAKDFENGNAVVVESGIYYVIDTNGTIIQKTSSTEQYVKNGSFGLRLSQDIKLTKAIYTNIDEFKERRARVIDQAGKFGFVDVLGNEVIPCTYDNATSFESNYANVTLGSDQFSINKLGECVKNCPSSNSEATAQWRYFRDKKTKLYGFVDANNVTVIPPRYEGAFNFMDDPLARVQRNNFWAYIDQNGQQRTAFKYTYAEPFANGFAKVRIGNKYGFINEQGKAITPIIYDHAYDFNNGITIVNIGLKYGYINDAGLPLTEVEFDVAEFFNRGVARVKKEGKEYFINKKGERVDIHN